MGLPNIPDNIVLPQIPSSTKTIYLKIVTDENYSQVLVRKGTLALAEQRLGFLMELVWPWEENQEW